METWILIDILLMVVLAIFGVIGALYIIYLREVVPLRMKTGRLRKKGYLLVKILTKSRQLIYALVKPTPAGHVEVKLKTQDGHMIDKSFTVDPQRVVYDQMFDIPSAIYYEDQLDPIPVRPDEKAKITTAQVEGIIHEVRRNALAHTVDLIPELDKRLRTFTILLGVSILIGLVAAGAAAYVAYHFAGAHATAAAVTNAGTVAHAAKTAAEANTVVHV